MAVDTAAKRAAAANFDGWHLPFPDGSDAENSAERAAVLGLYAMAAGEQPEEEEVVIVGISRGQGVSPQIGVSTSRRLQDPYVTGVGN